MLAPLSDLSINFPSPIAGNLVWAVTVAVRNAGRKHVNTKDPKNPYFDIQGVSHLALVSSDMARTVDFYEGVLGMPLIKTMELPKIPGSPLAGGGQHFFFDIGNGDCLAFFWWPNVPPAAPGVSAPTSVAGLSAAGSMHHIAFKVPPERIEQTARRLEESGIEWYGGPHPLITPEFMQMMASVTPEMVDQLAHPQPSHYDATLIDDDTFAYTMYFNDPDGILLEFCAWLPAYDRITREHEPVRAGNREQVAAPT
jgi:catechol 2,3-dioxygenase-like lactoylglutathione lyase family enzyme